MTRTKTFFYNAVSTGLLQIAIMLFGFVIPRLLLTTYGSEVNGLITSVTQFMNYFTLVEAGLSGATIYALYKPLADNNIGEVNGIVSAANRFYLQAGFLFSGLVGVLAMLYPLIVSPKSLAVGEVALLIISIGFKGAMEFFTLAKCRTLLTADQKTYVVSLTSLLYQICYTILIVIMVRMQFEIALVYLISNIAVLIRTAILSAYMRKDYNYLDYKATPNTQALNQKWDALFLQVLGVIQVGSPAVILTLIVRDLKIVSVYAVYNLVVHGINSILSIFIGGLSASFGDLIARDEQDTFQRAYAQFEFAYYALITIIYSVAYVMIMPFINLYTASISDVQYIQPILGALFIINGFLYNLKTPQGMLVISAGMYKETKWRTTTQGLIAVIGGCVLGYYYGLIGILIAQIISNIYRDIDLLFFIPRRLTKLPVRNTLYRWIWMFTCAALIIFTSRFFTISPSGYVQWVGVAVVVTAFAAVVVLSTGYCFNRKTFHEIIKRMLAMKGRRHNEAQ